MSIDMPADQVRALGRSLSGRADTVDEVRTRLADQGAVDGPLHAPVELFLDCHRALAIGLAGELGRLGTTVTGVADSWVQLDATLVAEPVAEPLP